MWPRWCGLTWIFCMLMCRKQHINEEVWILHLNFMETNTITVLICERCQTSHNTMRDFLSYSSYCQNLRLFSWLHIQEMHCFRHIRARTVFLVHRNPAPGWSHSEDWVKLSLLVVLTLFTVGSCPSNWINDVENHKSTLIDNEGFRKGFTPA